MPHFVIFCDDRLDGVQHYLNRYNLTDNTLELCVGEDLTTQELGGRAFAHHLLYPEDWLVVVPSPLDLFSWDEEVGLYLPLFSSAEAAIAAYGQWFDGIVINLLAHPSSPSDPKSTSHAGPWTVSCTSMTIGHFTTDSSPGAGN